MTTSGWLFLVAAWAVILGLVGFCYRIILGGPKENT